MSALDEFLEVVKRIESRGYRVYTYEQTVDGRWAFIVEAMTAAARKELKETRR